MAHLLHVDSSFQGDQSVSRRFTAGAADAWRATNPAGTVSYRDLAAHPLPHFDVHAHAARQVPPGDHTPAQAAAWQLAETLVGEVRAADAIILGAPMYNWSSPTQVKTWMDHLLAPGLSRDAVTQEGLLGGRDMTIISTHGGSYGPGTPKDGWNHADPWLAHVLSSIGLEPRFVVVEMTLADVVPALARFKDLAEASRVAARRTIAETYAPVAA